MRVWDEADIAEYLSILNRKKVSAFVAVAAETPAKPEVSNVAIAAATSSPTVIVQNHYHGTHAYEPPRQPEPPAPRPGPSCGSTPNTPRGA